MRNLSNRLSALERTTPELSPRVKAWLGWPLTDAEQAALDDAADERVDIDTSTFSKEARAWLGVD